MIVCNEDDLKVAIAAVVKPIIEERDYLHSTLIKTVGDYRATLLIAGQEKLQAIKLTHALRDLITECEAAGLPAYSPSLENARDVLRRPVRQ